MAPSNGTAAARLRGEVRAEMARQRVTRQTLADRTGIPVHQIDRRLSGQVEISFTEGEQFAAALGIPYADLVARVEGDAA